MKRRAFAVSAIAAVMGLSPIASPLHADPLKPTLAEVNSVESVLRFRSDMIADPDKAMQTHASSSGRSQLAAIGKDMEQVGSGKLGWRYLLGTSVFAATGVGASRMAAMFYNPWLDTALVTIWESKRGGRQLAEAEWVPGDLVRQANAEIDPRPLWLRGSAYRPQALADAVVETVKRFEDRLPEAQIAKWREPLGIKDGDSYRKLIPPILAARLLESQMRLVALAVKSPGEDARLTQLRAAVASLISDVTKDGFAKPLAQARETTAPMSAALAKINPKLLQGLAPTAYIVGDGYATVFYASTVTADFAISARYAERKAGYALQQFDYIPYAAIYQATVGVSPSGRR
jgi:hypothetical protein